MLRRRLLLQLLLLRRRSLQLMRWCGLRELLLLLLRI